MSIDSYLLDCYRRWYSREIATGSDNVTKFEYHLNNQLKELPLTGKRVLEVGCGKGAVSLYLAIFSGAKKITALDEAAGEGAPVGVNQVLRNAVHEFGIKNLDVVDADIMGNNYLDGIFDVIIANNALHHVVANGLVSTDQDVRKGYLDLFHELDRLLVSDGILSIQECSRQSFWRWSPLKFKWKHIDWELHPTLKEWLIVIKESGFEIQRCEYEVPYTFRNVSFIFSNQVAQFFILPGFFITARK